MVVVPARQATRPGGLGSLESILGLLISLKIQAQGRSDNLTPIQSCVCQKGVSKNRAKMYLTFQERSIVERKQGSLILQKRKLFQQNFCPNYTYMMKIYSDFYLHISCAFARL
jgi:hypothetical protein